MIELHYALDASVNPQFVCMLCQEGFYLDLQSRSCKDSNFCANPGITVPYESIRTCIGKDDNLDWWF